MTFVLYYSHLPIRELLKKSEIHINIYFEEYKLPKYICLLLAEFKNLGPKQTSPLRLFFLAKMYYNRKEILRKTEELGK